jgi:hypothetical protein
MTRKTLVPTETAAPAVVAAVAQPAQQGPLKRTTLQTGDFPPGYETVMVLAEMEPPGRLTRKQDGRRSRHG